MTTEEVIKAAMTRNGIKTKRGLARECGYRKTAKKDDESKFVHTLEDPDNMRLWFWVMLDKRLKFTNEELAWIWRRV